MVIGNILCKMQEAHVQFLARGVEWDSCGRSRQGVGLGTQASGLKEKQSEQWTVPKAKLREEEEPGDKGNCEFWIVSVEIWGLALLIVERT